MLNVQDRYVEGQTVAEGQTTIEGAVTALTLREGHDAYALATRESGDQSEADIEAVYATAAANPRPEGPGALEVGDQYDDKHQLILARVTLQAEFGDRKADDALVATDVDVVHSESSIPT